MVESDAMRINNNTNMYKLVFLHHMVIVLSVVCNIEWVGRERGG